MKYVDEFRNKKVVEKLALAIRLVAPPHPVRIMEVCGTHTQSFFRFGLKHFLPATVSLIAGPGCPVCVSTQSFIDRAIAFAQEPGVIVATFADMLRVPGSISTLEKERGRSRAVANVYSPLDALVLARRYPQKKVIFLSVGFETTAPAIALTIRQADKDKMENIFFFTSLKLITPAMRLLAADQRLGLSGFLCPGHVSSVIGAGAYSSIAKRYKIGCCVAGFEPVDMLKGIHILLKQYAQRRPVVANEYRRIVSWGGNRRAQAVMRAVFRPRDAEWRGLGRVPRSGLVIRREFARFDAAEVFPQAREEKVPVFMRNCRCADVLRGIFLPESCPLFGRRCTPDSPVGPCMISSEGACNARYRYKD